MRFSGAILRLMQETKDEQTWQLCEQYIAKKVAGVFFAPLERTAASDQTNHRVISALERADIPVVLLDRCILPYPRRSRHDLIGIDHRRAGYMITEHLLNLGCRRIAFVGYSNSAATVTARIGGYRDALFIAGISVSPDLVRSLDSDQISEVRMVMEKLKPEAIVCANDRTAGHLMQGLIQMNYRIPQDVRIVGIDDVEYASLLPVPLNDRSPTVQGDWGGCGRCDAGTGSRSRHAHSRYPAGLHVWWFVIPAG